jgi:plastocyanin
MRRTIARFFGLAATSSLAILWLIAAPTASAGDPCYHDFSMPTTSTQAATEIKLMPCAFAPTIANVPVGSKVTFFNGPDFVHLVTGANQSWGSRDVEIQPGGKVSYTFDREGVYPYACALHRGMSGAIIVGNAVATSGGGGAAAGTGAQTTGTAAASEETAGAAGGIEGPAMLALALCAGLIVGAAVVLVASRRRRTGDEPASPQAV